MLITRTSTCVLIVLSLLVALWYLANVIFGLPLGTTASQGQHAQPYYQQHYQQQRLLRFTYTISNTQSTPVIDATFASYLPVALTANQRAGKIKTASHFTEETGHIGNRIGRFDLGIIPPFGKKIVQFVAHVDTAESAHVLPLEDPSQYLQEAPYIELSHPDIIQLSQRLKGDTDQQSIERIYQWAATRIQYAGYVAKDRGAVYAIQNLKGDCTEYMYTVVALARALGIPARGIGGYVYQSNRVVSPADYHNWAEVFIDGQWRIVDAQKKSFMRNSEDYIAMRILSDASVSLLGNSHRFSVANHQLIIQM